MRDPIHDYFRATQPGRDGTSKTSSSTDELPEELRGDSWEPPRDQEQSQAGEVGTLLSTVRPERVEWLWPGRIPLGKLTILDGDPGLGKSVLSLDLAARMSRGLPMPDDAPGRQGGVVLLSAEDGLEDTIVPRLEAAGADRSRILALESVGMGTDRHLPSLPEDIIHIIAAIARVHALLVVVDPIMAYLDGKVNAHRDQDCRRALHPLAAMAQKYGVAVVVVRHLNKATGGSAIYRGGGSIGIIGAARSGLLVAKDPDNPDRRILASTKCNLAKLPPSLAYDLSTADNGALRIGWMGASPHSAESLLAAPRDDEDRDAIQDAQEVLRSILEGGSRPAAEIKKEARKAGVSERTLSRAKTILGVRSKRIGFSKSGEWYWELPIGCQT
jgi:hypothetical protein